MAEHSTIEWTDATWNPITGCSVLSPGCAHCYAMSLAGTRLQHHPSRQGLTTESKAGPVWNGAVRLNAEWLDQPLRWTRPRRIFVCAHGDLFHEAVVFEWIDRVFATMALAPQHTFQVLTKRAERMRVYLTDDRRPQICAEIDRLFPMRTEASRAARDRISRVTEGGTMVPLENVWLGVSAERQTEYDERKDHLRNTPATVRWFSMEPLLGHIAADYLADWVVAGGESGKRARPMHPDWVRSLRDQCAAAGVPFFFKQWGEWEPREEWSGHLGGGRFEPMLAIMPDGSRCPDDVIPQDVGAHRMARVGKKAAGAILDGKLHREMPR